MAADSSGSTHVVLGYGDRLHVLVLEQSARTQEVAGEARVMQHRLSVLIDQRSIRTAKWDLICSCAA